MGMATSTPDLASVSSANGSDRRVSKTAKRMKQEYLADLLCADKPVCEALLEAGYSASESKRGWASVPKIVHRLMVERNKRYEVMGKTLIDNPDSLERQMVGKNYETMMRDDKKSVDASKFLSTHKSVSTKFVQEQRNNVVVIQAPADWAPSLKAARPQPKGLPVAQDDMPEYE